MTDRANDQLRRWVLHGVTDDAPGVSGVVIDPPEEVLVVELDPERTVAAIRSVLDLYLPNLSPSLARQIYDALDPEGQPDD